MVAAGSDKGQNMHQHLRTKTTAGISPSFCIVSEVELCAFSLYWHTCGHCDREPTYCFEHISTQITRAVIVHTLFPKWESQRYGRHKLLQQIAYSIWGSFFSTFPHLASNKIQMRQVKCIIYFICSIYAIPASVRVRLDSSLKRSSCTFTCEK